MSQDWNAQMAAEYQEVLAIHSKHRLIPIDTAISMARANRVTEENRRVMAEIEAETSTPVPGDAPEPQDAMSFEPEPEADFDVVARIVRLERMVESLQVHGGLTQLLNDLGVKDGSIFNQFGEHASETVLEPGTIQPQPKAVIPDGYPMPSEELSEIRQQYAEAVSQLERAQWMQNQIGSRWKEIAFIPERAIQLAVCLMPIVEAMVEEAGLQANVDVLRVSIPRGLVVTAKAVLESTTAERVAMNEFVSWALNELRSSEEAGDVQSQILRRNLITTGMITS